MNRDELQSLFIDTFGPSKESISTFFAPGRVNIIGEHQDYNGGHVFPAALTVGIYGALRPRTDKKLRLYSANMESLIEVDLEKDTFCYQPNWDWANYPIGIVDYLLKKGHDLPGFDFYFNGNLPAGAGLSSSACILDLTGFMLLTYLGLPIDRTALAEMAQQVEYHFVGVKVGVMDQFAISQGKAGFGVLLDCTKMEFELVPLTWQGYELIIMNTNKKRGLVDSKFNERKGECDAALEEICKHRELSGLSLAKAEDMEYIQDEVLRRRATHAYTENLRVLEFVEALKNKNLPKIAELLKASHRSLKYDYEVSGVELDTIVEIAEAQPGCIASRMTGAGFGGCAIALVKGENVPDFMAKVPELYEKAMGTRPDLYDAHIGDGVYQL